MAEVHFGFDRAGDAAAKAARVMDVFSSVAERYDLMNDLMSLGLHRLWKRALIKTAELRPGMRVLDVAAGSGDLARLALEAMQGQGRVVLLDLNAPMLQEGMRRMVDAGFLPGRADGIVADGARLPFRDASFDRVLIAFGLRNFADPEAGLAEFHRVLKPGGVFVCLEFSRPPAWVMPAYDFYSFHCIPALGERITGDRRAYQYLVESIRRWPDASRLAKWFEQAGFAFVRVHRMSLGVVAVHRGRKL